MTAIWEVLKMTDQFNTENMKTRISTRIRQVLIIGVMTLLASCQQEMVEPEMNQKSEREVQVVLTARQSTETDTRIAYTPSTPESDGSIAMGVTWNGSDDEMLAYTYYDNEGVHLNYLSSVENSISNDGKSKDFSGTIIKNDGVNGQWHYLFYPLPWDSWITPDDVNKTLTIRYPMNNQVQDCTSGNETKHLAVYDIMWVMDSSVESGNATINLSHRNSLIYMDFTLPETKSISKIRLTSDQAIFGTEYMMKFRLADTGLSSGTDDDKMSTTMELTLQNDAADTSVKGYLMLTSYGQPEAYSVNLYAEAIAEDGTVYQSETTTVSTTGYLFEPGKCKTMKRTLAKAPMGDKTAAQAVKGDFAMADGTFISKDATLTEAQKANVRGIVFWTTADMNTDPNAQTPARLTDDKIMQTDFPNCNHGLIVALNNISGSSIWQSNTTDNLVADWQTSTFNASNKSDYSAINGYISNISGYQNTKLLKAYNKYCTENDQSNNVVVPVSLLENWDVKAPENTTGWYIPSPKELHMLCCKDVDNIFYAHGNGVTPETRNFIDLLLSVLSGTSLGSGNYWSSMEGSIVEGENMYGAIRLRFTDGAPFGYTKNRDNAAVRAICAF